jgi:hypothetical protein
MILTINFILFVAYAAAIVACLLNGEKIKLSTKYDLTLRTLLLAITSTLLLFWCTMIGIVYSFKWFFEAVAFLLKLV